MNLEQKKRIGNVINKKRTEKEMTQAELAENTGLSRSYIADIEAGRYAPSVESLTCIAAVLKIDLNFLTKNDGNTIEF